LAAAKASRAPGEIGAGSDTALATGGATPTRPGWQYTLATLSPVVISTNSPSNAMPATAKPMPPARPQTGTGMNAASSAPVGAGGSKTFISKA